MNICPICKKDSSPYVFHSECIMNTFSISSPAYLQTILNNLNILVEVNINRISKLEEKIETVNKLRLNDFIYSNGRDDLLDERIEKLKAEIEKIKMPTDSVENPIGTQCHKCGSSAMFASISGGWCKKCWEEKPYENLVPTTNFVCHKCRRLSDHSDCIFMHDNKEYANAITLCINCWQENQREVNDAKEIKPKFKVGQWWEDTTGNRRHKITDISIEWIYCDTSIWRIDGTACNARDNLVKLIEDVE